MLVANEEDRVSGDKALMCHFSQLIHSSLGSI